MASDTTTNEPLDGATVSFAGDVLAARIAPLAIAAMVALVALLTATGAFSDVRDAIKNTPSNDDAGFYQTICNHYGEAVWNDCYGGPLGALMPGAIDTSKAGALLASGTTGGGDEAAEVNEASGDAGETAPDQAETAEEPPHAPATE